VQCTCTCTLHLNNILHFNRSLVVHLTTLILFLITGTPYKPFGESLSEVLKVEENMKLRCFEIQVQTESPLPCSSPSISPVVLFSLSLCPPHTHTHLHSITPSSSFKYSCTIYCRRQQLYDALEGTNTFPLTLTAFPRYVSSLMYLDITVAFIKNKKNSRHLYSQDVHSILVVGLLSVSTL